MASKRNRFPDEEGGGDAWLATYGDMITLLMCFFVIFFSVSDVNVALFEDMKNHGVALTERISAPIGADIDPEPAAKKE